nr:bacteriophage Gp15 family protein [uncultured Anaerostipes sp.]
MNILTDRLPGSVLVADREYRINTDFRVSVLFEEMIQDKNITEEQQLFIEELMNIPEFEGDHEKARLLAKYNSGLALYYPVIPEDLEGAISQMLWFYQCGKTEEQKQSGKGKKQSQIYSFTHDADYIYAAFMEQYGIDLNAVELHWWKFSAMFAGLKEDCLISKIMGYRATDTAGMDKEQKKFYKKMKEIYKLPENVSEEDRALEEEVTQALMNGGDLSQLLN